MSGFAGFFDAVGLIHTDPYSSLALVRRMGQRIAHRGKNGKGIWFSEFCALAQVSSAAPKGSIPAIYEKDGFNCAIGFDGQLENTDALRSALQKHNITCPPQSDADLVLQAYLCFGFACVEKLFGVFSFVLVDTQKRQLFLCRDRFGVKPLFFTVIGKRIIFGSEIKALLEYPEIHPAIGKEGLQELLGMGPVRTPGTCVFSGIQEVRPGSFCVFNADGLQETIYHRLSAKPHLDSAEDTIEKLSGWISQQNCAFSADLSTDTMKHRSGLECWMEPIIARDLPGTAPGDVKLLQNCRQSASAGMPLRGSVLPSVLSVKQNTLSDILYAKRFSPLLHPEIAEYLQLEHYAASKLTEAADQAVLLRGESADTRRARIELHKRLRYNLPHLLERLDRCSAFCGTDLQIADLDPDLIEYLYNIPAGLISLPELLSVFTRLNHLLIPLSAPVPDETYTLPILSQFKIILKDRNQPLHQLFDPNALRTLLAQPDSQMLILYLLQLNLWMVRYNIRVTL